MSLEVSVKGCCAGLISLKAFERRKNGEALKDFLTRNAVPSLLSENTIKKTGFTWDNLFSNITEYVFKETEKFESAKTYESTTKPLLASLLNLCVSGSIKGRAYVKCDHLIEECLTILRDKRLTIAIGDAYLNLLDKHVLTCEHYINHIKPSAWEELLDLCLNVCRDNKSTGSVDNYTKVKLLWLVIKNGTNSCQFAIPLRDNSIKLKNCLIVALDDKKMLEIVVEIVTLVVQTLAIESRLATCQFAEALLSSILKHYDQNLDQKKKFSLFKLLLLLISLHHPQGKKFTEEVAQANNWAVWNKQIRSILEVVSLETVFLQKGRQQNEKFFKHYTDFYRLAALAYYQVFNMPNAAEDIEGESAAKRQRLSLNKNKCFVDLIEEFKQNQVPWLEIMQVYVQKYGTTIRSTDCISLLVIIESLVSNNKVSNWKALQHLVCFLIIAFKNCENKQELESGFLSLWNSCLRSSTVANGAHKAVHNITRTLLTEFDIPYQNIQPLVKLYSDRGMPVTDESLKTLTLIFHKYSNKCCSIDQKTEHFSWFVHAQTHTVNVADVRNFLLRILSRDNVDDSPKVKSITEYEKLHHTLFRSIEDSILFSEFEMGLDTSLAVQELKKMNLKIDVEVNKQIKDFLHFKLSEYVDKLSGEDVELLHVIKFTHIVTAYLDVMLDQYYTTQEQVQDQLYRIWRSTLEKIFTKATKDLKNRTIEYRPLILEYLHEILMQNYHPMLSSAVRLSMNEGFFDCITTIMNTEISLEEVLYEGDDQEMHPNLLRHNAICLMAAYCRKTEKYTEKVLDFILEPNLYSFTLKWDIDTALQCINTLSQSEVEQQPIELMFILMQNMCRSLCRNPQASKRILESLSKIFEQIWSNEDLQRNCCIMVKGYLQICEDKFYPPNVAAIIYECAAKIAAKMAAFNINPNLEVNNCFKEAVMKKIKGEIHSLRLICCYFMKHVLIHISDVEIEEFVSGLADIFTIQVSERHDSILKDETNNRTLTVLHFFFALSKTKKTFLNTIITSAMQMQKEKKLDMSKVKKTLSIITETVAGNDISAYLNDNILSVLNYWFLKGNLLQELPVEIFGFENEEAFYGKHLKWLISAETLWQRDGLVKYSEVLKYVQRASGQNAEDIIEACICNIIVLSLPYVVKDSNGIPFRGPANMRRSADRMFQTTRELLGDDKWSGLFVENMSDLITWTAALMRDPVKAKEEFNVNVPDRTDTLYYTRDVYLGILEYIEQLIGENTMKYLCQNQPLSVLKALFHLWKNVLKDNAFEYKILHLHTYMTYIECIPLNNPSDTFVCNFVCTNFCNALKNCKDRGELKALLTALQRVLRRYLIEKADALKSCVSRILTILMVKQEQGFTECAPLVTYLKVDMRDYIEESVDVVDFISSLSVGAAINGDCSTYVEFQQELRAYQKSMCCPSYQSLLNMRKFLETNKAHVVALKQDFNKKGFSDDCGNSALHQIIHALTTIMKTSSDVKTTTEACRCLEEIGNYDLKTLLTVPPAPTQRIRDVHPRLYFAIVSITSFTEVLFDENPTVTSRAANALQHLLKYQEASTAVDLEIVDKQLLEPFVSKGEALPKNSKHEPFAIFEINDSKLSAVCASRFWIPKEESHAQWVMRITTTFLEVLMHPDNYLESLQKICVLKPDVCKKIIPALVGLVLECATDKQTKIISHQINEFFIHIWDEHFESRSQNSNETNDINGLSRDYKCIVQDCLEVVDFVRLQINHYSSRNSQNLETLNYLQLDYGKVAWAATLAEQNLAAIFYGELWAMAANGGVPPAAPEVTTLLDGGGGEHVQRILRMCYVSIGEMDAIDGCGTAHLTSETEKRKHLISTGQFTDSLLLYDIALSLGQMDPELQYGTVKSLHKSGMHHLALQYIKSLPENEQLNDIKYDCLSFLGDWSAIVDSRELERKCETTNNPMSIIKAYRYSCLKDCLNIQSSSDNELTIDLPLNQARLAVAKLCQNLNMENCQSVYNVLARLHSFRDIEDYQEVINKEQSITKLLDRWQVENLPAFRDFKHLEPLIYQRSVILECAGKSYGASLENIVGLQLQYVEMALANQRVQMAQRLLAVVKKMDTSQAIALTEGQISWAKGHTDIALSLLRKIVANPSPDVRLNAKALRQYGMWMAEIKYVDGKHIIEQYLKKSLDVLGRRSDHQETRLKVYYDMALFADNEYKRVEEYMNSPIFEKKVKCLENMKDMIKSLNSTSTSLLSKDDRIALHTNRKFEEIDKADIANTKIERNTFLHLAMRYYLLSLKEGDSNNLSMFRVISLWLDNPNIEFSDEQDQRFEDMLHAIPSLKYIAVLPQLGPRLSNEETRFADNLRQLIKRCALDHPHHTLPILFSLKNSDKDKTIVSGSSSKTSLESRDALEPRVQAACDLIEGARSGPLSNIIQQMELMCDAMISFANCAPNTKELKQKIPRTECIHRLGHLDAIPVPTDNIIPRSDCKYTYTKTLHSIEPYFELVGGVNCPKKIRCKSSDGRTRIVLVKGQDDLRQDAVMQQVFNIVNTLLDKDPVTSRNNLLIRTYKVVPMSKRSGVLEWCEGTMPIGMYLIGNGREPGAHSRYRPKDISAVECRTKLKQYQETKTQHNNLPKGFLMLLKKFRPVFHYFFTEYFLDPVTWYERRLAYTKSVAVSSMVGYILGLGDRHLNNILIDKHTAEVVHIDFGIAFDKGKTLPTPETIPFRLTQDIVAGFGCSGVEGTFRRCCEKTMQLLRDNQETLLTILEVLLCDPLYSWTVTTTQRKVPTDPSKDSSVQHSADGSLAKRALLGVRSKLDGGGAGVTGLVSSLIRDAMDPTKLCCLYIGWQAYL